MAVRRLKRAGAAGSGNIESEGILNIDLSRISTDQRIILENSSLPADSLEF